MRSVTVLALCSAVLAGCGGDDGASPGATPLSAEEERGLEVARSQGCTSCHSTDGRDALGPSWQGLHGSTVELGDGSSVVADEDYLIRSIQEPDAQIREGFRAIMPERSLEPDDLDAVVAYLRAVGS